MTVPITLSNIGSIPQNPTSAETTINSNNASITTAFDSALSTSGDQMQGNIDMNSNRILNLPEPSSNLEPARLVDLEVLTGSGTITINPLPAGGTVGQVLEKNSSSNYDASWATLSTFVNSIDGVAGLFTTGNGIVSTGKEIQITPARLTLPTRQSFSTGSGTYTTPANVLWLRVRLVGGGAGGGGSGSGPSNGGSGGATTFGSSFLTANGGTGGGSSSSATGVAGGTGGIATGGNVFNLTGSDGTGGQSGSSGGNGGTTHLGGGGVGGVLSVLSPTAGKANTGSGGGGAGSALASSSVPGGGGGGAGGYCETVITSPLATYAYSIGAGGTAGAGGGQSGAVGGSGYIVVEEFYGS